MEPTMSQTSPSGKTPSTNKLRAALLGAVALVGVGGFAYQSQMPALAQAPALTVPANAAAPVSFAPIVERVRGAVVAVKVKTVETADASDDEQGGNAPQMRPGDPLERFFRRFGGENTPFGRQ